MSDVGTLDDAYLEWLYSQVAYVNSRRPDQMYWKLMIQLYSKPFGWSVRNDDNRAEEGRQLRLEFLESTGYQLQQPIHFFMDLDCSMLEMLIALSRASAFETDGDTAGWFWRFIYNLELHRYSDDIYEISIQEEVEEALNRVIQRTYSPSGQGGLFPLRNTVVDQRRVELWYQKEAYILEGLYVHATPVV